MLEKINNFLIKNIFCVLILLIVIFCFGNFNNKFPNPIITDNNNSIAGVRNKLGINRTAIMASSYSVDTTVSSMVVKNFALGIEVKDAEKTRKIIDNKIKDFDIKVDNFNSFIYGNNQPSFSYSLKVPTDKIEIVLENFKELGVVKNESNDATNKSEQYLDNEGRVKNLYVRRDRLRKMMETKTDKLADVLAIDRELSNVQQEIEKLEKSNKKIDDDVNYSRLSLNIIPEIEITDFNNSNWKLRTSWRIAVNDLIVFSQKTVDWSLKIIVFIPVIFIVALFCLLLRKK
jgi:hypothetical protein